MHKTTIIIAGDGEDFWTLIHQPGKCRIADFCYGQESSADTCANIAENTAEFFGADTARKEVELDFGHEIEEIEGTAKLVMQLTSPSGKIYTGETETECLEELLKSEPDALVDSTDSTAS